ncbi:hypothetical protein GCM10008096_23490 [Zhihengliuella salsuginis]|uniref:Uncharacterized protein n=1 Tax=Zhihengliuella salsuginis TaxID=578222 RepID=A0ABQ3GJ75_9MICC|nr:hypothetical protein GCM10008096_23490 [Zhihengliuella salsuginis]
MAPTAANGEFRNIIITVMETAPPSIGTMAMRFMPCASPSTGGGASIENGRNSRSGGVVRAGRWMMR